MAGSTPGPILCVDIGGTSTKIGLFEQSPPVEIIDSIPSSGPASSFMEALCTRIRGVLNTKFGHPVFGLAVAVAGFLDKDRDRMIYNSNLPWLENYPLRAHLAREFEARVELEVDSNAAALAEQRFGAGQNSKRFLCIAVGTGLGVGLIIDGQPLRFSYGCLGDAGHVVIERDGPLCSCGGSGCAEIFVSAPVLAEQYRAARRLDTPTSLRDVILAARDGDQAAIQVLDTAGGWLGVASASLANIFFPDRIAFAGGLAEAGDFVMTSLRRTFETSASQFARDQVTLCRARLGAHATITGAACAFIYPDSKKAQPEHAG